MSSSPAHRSYKLSKVHVAPSFWPSFHLADSDRALLLDSGTCGLVWILKDSFSVLHYRGSLHQAFISSALITEALALLSALLSTQATHSSHLACLSDCQEIVRLLNTGDQSNDIYKILCDICTICLSFSEVVFAYSLRSDNSEAEACDRTIVKQKPEIFYFTKLWLHHKKFKTLENVIIHHNWKRKIIKKISIKKMQ